MRKAKAQPENTVATILRAGQIVDGKYRVDRLIGRGGMAAVWAGTNKRTGKRVALKVILQSLASTREAQQLLQSEALAASRVNHPNVVTVFDVIEHEGMTCIVMELLHGEPLGSYIARNGFLSIAETAAVLLPAMRGVAAAHAHGVIHRDLKPQNIFICIGPDKRIVTTKVLDFGISLMVERATDPSAGPVPGLSMGTPGYLAPEHISGASHIDQRADVYGFGVLLYEALTGQMAFPGEPGTALFDRILNDPAPSVAQLRPDLPPGLVHIIERAMAKEPDQRYSGLNSMVAALEDELAPATPAPRMLTPRAGVPSAVLGDPQSGPHPASAAQVVVNREPSGPHPASAAQVVVNREPSGPHPASAAQAVPRREPSGPHPAPAAQAAVNREPSGPHPAPAVQAVLRQEPSGQHQETQILFGFPLEKERRKKARNGEADGGSNNGLENESAPSPNGEANNTSNEAREEESAPTPSWEPDGASGASNEGWDEESAPTSSWEPDVPSNDDLEDGTPTSRTGRDTARVLRRRAFAKAPYGLASLSSLRGWRGLVGAAVVGVLVVVVWMAVRDADRMQAPAPAPVAKPAPPASVPVAKPAPPASELVAKPAPPASSQPAAPPAVPAEVPTTTMEGSAPLAASPSPTAPSKATTPKHSKAARHARAASASVIHSGSRGAEQEDPSLWQPSRGAAKGDESAGMPSPAPRAGASEKHAAPRAGRLSPDDF